MHFELIKDYSQTAKVEHKLSGIILLTIVVFCPVMILGSRLIILESSQGNG